MRPLAKRSACRTVYRGSCAADVRRRIRRAAIERDPSMPDAKLNNRAGAGRVDLRRRGRVCEKRGHGDDRAIRQQPGAREVGQHGGGRDEPHGAQRVERVEKARGGERREIMQRRARRAARRAARDERGRRSRAPQARESASLPHRASAARDRAPRRAARPETRKSIAPARSSAPIAALSNGVTRHSSNARAGPAADTPCPELRSRRRRARRRARQ